MTASSPLLADPLFAGLNVLTLLASLGMIFVVAIAHRERVRRSQGQMRPSPIIALLLTYLVVNYVMFVALAVCDPAAFKLIPIELVGICIVGFSLCSASYLALLPHRHKALQRGGGFLMGLAPIIVGALTHIMGHPAAQVTDGLFWFVPVALIGLTVAAFILPEIVLKGYRNQMIGGVVVLLSILFAFQFGLLSVFRFEASNLEVFNHDGLSHTRLNVFVWITTALALGLAGVMGDDPRRHWRRYAISATMVAALAMAVHTATNNSLRSSASYNELARLLSSLDASQAGLNKAADVYRAEGSTTGSRMVRAVREEVFLDLQTYYDASVRIERLITQLPASDRPRVLYFGDPQSETGSDALHVQIPAFYGSMKSVFGLSSEAIDFDTNAADQLDSNIEALAREVRQKTRAASDIQALVKDMSLFGGVMIVLFMVFGVFLPAHRSTIAALKALEEEKERAEKLALSAKHITKGIVLTDGAGYVTWINDAFEKISGYSEADVIGTRISKKLINDLNGPELLGWILGELANHRGSEFEASIERKDGSTAWYASEVRPIVENGEIVQVIHIFDDITEERSMRERLVATQAENERLALIARHAGDGMAITDPMRRVLWVNRAWSDMSGYSLDDFSGTTIAECLSGKETDQDKLHEYELLQERREPVEDEFVAYSKKGNPYWINASSYPIFGDDGEYQGCVVVHRDITERKELELELIASRDDLAARVEERTQTIVNQSLELEKALAAERELNKMQTEFVSMASHEFRTPLTIIDGVSRRLEKRADRLSPDEIRERSATLRSTVTPMTMLVERTLDASRLSSGRIKLTPERFNLPALMEDVVGRQKELAPAHTIEMVIDGLPETLFADARLMDNVVTNLMSNAVKYSGDSQFVRVTGSQDDTHAIIAVRDHGIGIPADELPKIFQRFFRASTSTGIPGTGIGLNLVKSLIDMHHGEVTLDSVEGEWTEFTVRLPIKSPLETDIGETAPDVHGDLDNDLEDTNAA